VVEGQVKWALDIIKNNGVVGGIFSSSYHTDTIDTKHEEIFPLTTQNISIEEGLDRILDGSTRNMQKH
jgi:hypothetical protein